MIFKNYKAVLCILYHLLGNENFVITGSIIDSIHLNDKDIVIKDMDIIIKDSSVLENLNPYFNIKRIKVIKEKSIENVEKLFIMNILNVSLEFFLVKDFKDVETVIFLGLPFKINNINGRKKGLINFIDLAEKQKDFNRILKYKQKLKRYNANGN